MIHFNKINFMLLVLLFSFSLQAQLKMKIEGEAPGFFISHVVKAKETWFSLGRMYNLPPKELAAANATTIEAPLKTGQLLKVSLLSGTNFIQSLDKSTEETLIPLYHEVKEKEWMYRVSVLYNKVPIDQLEQWNKMKSDQIRPGMQLVVGYLKVKTNQSVLVNTSASNGLISSSPSVVATSAAGNSGSTPTAIQPPVIQEKVTTLPSTEAGPQTPVAVINFKGGSFKKQYAGTGNQLTGNAGLFKSTSGWTDGKYYALIDGVNVGTIVKVGFSSTNKHVYAKVLGGLPDMKESKGLLMRLSDAAASELGVANAKFFVEVEY